jgi:hypothetical protein
MAKQPFDEARPKTPRARVLERERKNAQIVRMLMEEDCEEGVDKILEECGLLPGSAQFEAAKAVWREAKT